MLLGAGSGVVVGTMTGCACLGQWWPCLYHWSRLSEVERLVVARRVGFQLPVRDLMTGHVHNVVAKVSRVTRDRDRDQTDVRRRRERQDERRTR